MTKRKLLRKTISDLPQPEIYGRDVRMGTADYHFGKYHEAIKAFGSYLKDNAGLPQRRDALYMLGMSYYRTGVYSRKFNYPGRGDCKQRCAYTKRISAHGIGLLAACRQEQGAYGI